MARRAPAARTRQRGVRTWLLAGLAALLAGTGAGAALAVAGSSDPGTTAPVENAAGAPAVEPVATGDAGASAASPADATRSSAAEPVSPSPTVIVLDASGSMNADDGPGPRIDAAKNAVQALIDGLPDGSPVGLVVYGTATDSSDAAEAEGCRDIKTVVPVGPLDRAAFKAQVGGIVASGYTPLGSALSAAADQLPADGPRTVIVVSDGDDTCQPPEPCAVATDLSTGDLTIHSVGFRVSGSAKDALACIAQAGHGKYVDAANATQLQAFLRTAADPNATVNTLTHSGFGDLTIGMTADQARAVDAGIDPAATGTVVVVWRDCELTFVDGTLTAIEPRANRPTQDGLAIGDDAGKAGLLYGASAVQTDGARPHAVFAVEPGSEIGYDVTFTAAAPGQLAGPITRIVLCRCRPAAAGAASTVSPDDYLKTAGRWWFRTPDDGWNCRIATTVFCESGYYTQNRSATYPSVTDADRTTIDCGEIGLVPGSVTTTSATAQYGQCGHGEASEFYYDADKGNPGLGRILADGQVLSAGGFRCFVTGFAVTCGPGAGDRLGFTVDQSQARIYPRDGAPPEPGGPSPAAPVIGPSGFGVLRLGMTISEAQQADPSLTVTSNRSGGCTTAETTDAEAVVFNRDGTLSWIKPRGAVQTPEGLTVGETADRAFDLYLVGEPHEVSINYGVNWFPVARGSKVHYLLELRGPDDAESTYPARLATITGINLDGGQECFS